MEFYSIIYGAITLSFLLYCYQLVKAHPHARNQPPEAGGAWPFIGHLHLLGGGFSSKLPHINLADLSDTHGPVFTIRLGVHRALIISSAEYAKELFTTCDAVVSSRPKLTGAKHLGYNFVMFPFAPYGPFWRQIRKLTSSDLLSSRRVELLRTVRVSETVQSVNELYRLWCGEKDGSGRAFVAMKQWFGNLNLNVVLRVVAGKRSFGTSGGDMEEARRCRVVIRDFFHLVGLFVVADALPYLGWLDIGGYEKRMKKAAVKFDKLLEEWLEEHRKKEYSGEAEGKMNDFMDVMLSVVRVADFDGQHDADTIIKATCGALIAGGSDTVTVTLVWTLSLLLNHRHVLKKVQEELDTHVGINRRVNESDISNLVYLQAVVKESLRLYPPAPLNSAREFTKDTNVLGHHVPKGTWLIINLWKLHRDPQAWPDEPLEFKPERFLNSGKDVDVKGQDFELIPFGAGRRMCPGANLGLQNVHLVLASLLQAFEISTVDDELVDMTESAGLTNIKATPLDVLVAPRLDPSLY